jgi:hypothetical protein
VRCYAIPFSFRPVQDLFIIEASEMAAVAERQKRIGPALASAATGELH